MILKELLQSMNESWNTGYQTPRSERGKYKGKTIAELKAMRSALMAIKDKTDDQTEKLREINFALRAKSGWGKVPN